MSFVTAGSRAGRKQPSLNIWSGEPGGRLTVTSGSPVLTANATAQSTIYYSPYIGNKVPIFDPLSNDFVPTPFTEISLALDSTNTHTGYHQSGKNFDVFAWMRGGKVVLGTGPAWSSDSARASAIARVNGMWMNSVALTLRYDTTTNTTTLAPNRGTYLGTFRATADGQTGMNFNPNAAAGGTANVLGVYNAYNRVHIVAYSRDNTASWTYATASWRPADGNNANSISYMDGLGDVVVSSTYTVGIGTSTSGSVVGINRNSTSATPDFEGIAHATATPTGNFPEGLAAAVFLPTIGFNVIYAMEAAYSTTSQTYYGSGWGGSAGQTQVLTFNAEM